MERSRLESTHANSNVLSLIDLDIARGGVRVCRGITLSLERGARVFVTGPNGGGKSTLLMAIAGVLEITGGSILFETEQSDNSRRRRRLPPVAYLPQSDRRPGLPFSALEVVRLGREAAQTRASVQRAYALIDPMDALSLFGVAHLEHRSYRRLSGGEQQRVSLARCVFQGAEVLILDEPLAFVETAMHSEIVEILSSLPGAPAVVVATHHPELFASAGWSGYTMTDGVLHGAS